MPRTSNKSPDKKQNVQPPTPEPTHHQRFAGNAIEDPAKLLDVLYDDDQVNYCQARDKGLCGPRKCKKMDKGKSVTIHLPDFEKKLMRRKEGEAAAQDDGVLHEVREEGVPEQGDPAGETTQEARAGRKSSCLSFSAKR